MAGRRCSTCKGNVGVLRERWTARRVWCEGVRGDFGDFCLFREAIRNGRLQVPLFYSANFMVRLPECFRIGAVVTGHFPENQHFPSPSRAAANVKTTVRHPGDAHGVDQAMHDMCAWADRPHEKKCKVTDHSKASTRKEGGEVLGAPIVAGIAAGCVSFLRRQASATVPRHKSVNVVARNAPSAATLEIEQGSGTVCEDILSPSLHSKLPKPSALPGLFELAMACRGPPWLAALAKGGKPLELSAPANVRGALGARSAGFLLSLVEAPEVGRKCGDESPCARDSIAPQGGRGVQNAK
jgi:hypothetical protein